MKAAAVVAFTIVIATAARADEHEGSGRRASPATDPSWEFAITAYPTDVRGGAATPVVMLRGCGEEPDQYLTSAAPGFQGAGVVLLGAAR